MTADCLRRLVMASVRSGYDPDMIPLDEYSEPTREIVRAHPDVAIEIATLATLRELGRDVTAVEDATRMVCNRIFALGFVSGLCAAISIAAISGMIV